MKIPPRLVTSLGLAIAGANLAMTAQAATWSDNVGNAAFLETRVTSINDNHFSVGVANDTTFIVRAFWDTASGGATALPSLYASGSGVQASCAATAVSNAPTSTAVIIGTCEDVNEVSQGVAWHGSNLSAPPVQLQPLPILAGLHLVADVETDPVAVNQAGVVAGNSISPTGEISPVTWTAGGAANLLSPPLLGSVTNCSVADISDAATPSIIGNCPAGAGGLGKNQAVLWANASSGYSTLAVPSGASYCVASAINASGKILGTCYYTGTGSGTPNTYKTVQWATGGASAPAVLLTINGSTSLRNSGIAMNASGQITGNREKSGGFTTAFFWDPATGNNATPIPLLPGSAQATAKAISNNGIVVGCGEVNGASEAFAYHSVGAALIPISSLGAGGNDCADAISPNGAYTAGISEDASVSQQGDGVVTNTP
ncbi:HAF family protein [Pseudomonas asplenii]|uniref:HAF family protein n=1 Tax=Pseudomonas asplenii TaxID=53407 RepID=UPI0023608477|nr:HAF family protein [Pseudomonas asplenii]